MDHLHASLSLFLFSCQTHFYMLTRVNSPQNVYDINLDRNNQRPTINASQSSYQVRTALISQVWNR